MLIKHYGKDRLMKKPKFASTMSLLTAAFIVVLFIFILNEIKRSAYKDDSEIQDGYYNVSVGEKEYKNVKLSELTFPTVEKGTLITYSTVLKGNTVDNPIIMLYSVHSAIKVYLDDKLIHEYGDTDWHMLGYGYMNVDLPDDYAGKTIRIEQIVNESGEVSSIYYPRIYDSRHLLHDTLDKNITPLVIDISLLVISLTIMLISMLFMNILPSLKNLVWLAVSFFCMGLWELCSYNLIWLFSDNLALRGYVEYCSLYIAPFFLTLYFFDDFYLKEKGKTRYLYAVILALQGIFPVLALLLHFTDVRHLPGMLLYNHILLFVDIIMILFMVIRQIKRKEAMHRSMLVGITVLIAFGICDLVRFNFFRYVKKSSQVHYTSYLLMGFFVFMITMIIDFFMNQRKGLYLEARNDALNRLAYVDMLTDIANRRRCEEVFDELVETGEIFGIISFDMNYLKLTNDKYGHMEGDRLLTDFSSLISGVFSEYGTVGRMGGDEFIVILRNVDKLQFELLEQKLEEKRLEISKDRKPFPINYAYGYCRSDDSELEIKDGSRKAVNEVYKIADARMYENKLAMKRKYSPMPGEPGWEGEING